MFGITINPVHKVKKKTTRCTFLYNKYNYVFSNLFDQSKCSTEPMKTNNFSWLKEKYIFYSVLIINLSLLSTVRYYPSMDGPAHLYNSNLIYHLLKGDCTPLYDFYTFNKILIPNWIGHFILASLYFIFPAWLAEKAMLILYLTGLVFSFRLLVKQICPENIYLSIFIFPFAYSFLFHLGFYNYSISFIFLFTTIYYWLKTKNEHNFKKYLILFGLFTLTYFSNALTFCFLGLCLGLYIISYEIDEYLCKKDLSFSIKSVIKKLTVLFLVSLPGLILLIVFYKTTTFFHSQGQYSASELTKWINHVRALISYDYTGEEIITQQFLHLAVIITSISIFLRVQKNLSKSFASMINKNDIILLPVLIALIALYIVPDSSGAGMMSDRYCLMFSMLLLIWVSTQPVPQKIGQLILALVIVFHFGLLFKDHNGTIRNLDHDASLIAGTSKYVKQGSIVLPINMSDNWLEGHFSNYLGVDKPMIILENYEANVGWFPIKWNLKNIPDIVLNDKNSISGIQWINNPQSKSQKRIDYILLYGNPGKIEDPNWNELKVQLSAGFKLKYKSENNYVMLYERF